MIKRTFDPQKRMANIIDTATNTESLKTLVTAIEAAGIIEILKNPGPYTVLAPTDEAFAKLPANTLANLLQADVPKLRRILMYHLVSGDVRSDDLVDLDEAPTLEGSVVAVTNSDGIQVNDAKVLKSDILTDNGVIHIIDAVLMPALVAGH